MIAKMDINGERMRRSKDKYMNYNDLKSEFYEFIERHEKIKLSTDFKKFFDTVSVLGSKHYNLSEQEYFTHPVRVAKLALQFYDGNDIYMVLKLALVHNLIEVSGICQNELRAILGNELYKAVENLTIDRAARWEFQYLNDYYNNLEKSCIEIKLIKVCDKIDNMFLLEDNPCMDVKKLYLQEISDYVTPLAECVSEKLANYIKDLAISVKNRIKR